MLRKEISKPNNIIIKFSYLFVFLLVSFSVFALSAQGATLSLSPSSGTYTAGSFITVNILVSSPDKTMNAASGVVSFPANLLSVSSISKDASIVDFWAQEPSFSNTAGTVNFESVLLPPGFTGNSGKLLTVIFQTKSPGMANISFSSGSVLASDGVGTEIITGTRGSSYQISDSEGQPVIIVPKDTGVPSAPEISSDTHPDSNKWYALNDANFSWNLQKDIIGSSVLVDRNAKSSPTVLYNPPISSKEAKDLKDGTWYIHVQLENSKGLGAVSHFRFNIDTEKPTAFDIAEIKRDDPTNPIAKFKFTAVDKTSGIDHYEIQIDNNSPEIWKDDGSHIYATLPKEGGTHILLVRAVDKAGNFIINSAEFSVKALDAPIITDYPSELESTEVLTVKGTTKYFNSQAVLSLENENGVIKSYSSKADKDGKFTVVSNDRLKNGIYTAWVQIIDGRGAKSLPSEKITISVKKSAFITIGSWAVSLLAVLIPLIALILLIIFLSWYVWHKFFIMGKKIKKEVREAEDALHKAFDLLKESVREQVKILEKVRSKRKLTEEEEKINEQLRKDLEDAEKYVRKEIKDIEDLVK